MDMDLIRTFLTVAKLGHVTRASLQLHLTQPAISAQLKRLEAEVGQPLFDRIPKGVVLTAAGEVFYRYAADALDCLERGKEAVEELEGLHRGSLAVGGGATATTYLFPPHIGHFHRTYPDVHLYIREQGSAKTLEMVLAGELDFGIATLPKSGELPRHFQARLQAVPWVEDELRLLVPKKHRWSRRKQFSWEELEGESLILFEAGSAVRELIDERFKDAGIAPKIVMELRSIESIKQMVAQGLGAAFVSRHALGAGEEGLICKKARIERQLAVVHRKDRRMSRAASVFLEQLMEHGADAT